MLCEIFDFFLNFFSRDKVILSTLKKRTVYVHILGLTVHINPVSNH
jgi:hypothetical protein